MPVQHPREGIGQPSGHLVRCLAATMPSDLRDALDGQGMHRWLTDSAGPGHPRGIFAVLRAGPAVGAREVSFLGRVENDVWQHAGTPLPGEEGVELHAGAPDVNMSKSDGNECGIPAPLVRI
ncbi:MAG: hypothetical protein WKF83_14850 [Nocardioidaceae bacterium]